jgi:hypothetical protein
VRFFRQGRGPQEKSSAASPGPSARTAPAPPNSDRGSPSRGSRTHGTQLATRLGLVAADTGITTVGEPIIDPNAGVATLVAQPTTSPQDVVTQETVTAPDLSAAAAAVVDALLHLRWTSSSNNPSRPGWCTATDNSQLGHTARRCRLSTTPAAVEHTGDDGQFLRCRHCAPR